jgi:molybdopterin-guanine dinucleotide biosynthesis protein A
LHITPPPDSQPPLTPNPSPAGGEGSQSGFGGIVLCGGQSSRMGQSKAMLPFGNETLLQRAVRILGSVAWPIVVIAAKEQNLPELPAGAQILRDDLEAQGPLPALALGLQALAGDVDVAFALACDLPFLQAETIVRITNSLEQQRIAAPWSHCFFHPLAAAYRTEVLPELLKMQASGERSLQRLFERIPAERVAVADDELRNLNTPVDYQSALGT